MNTSLALPGNSDSTFLTHLFARGLEGQRYVVERFAQDGARARLRLRRALRRRPRRQSFAPGRRGHRDGAVGRHRRSGNHGGHRALRREPRHLRASARRSAARHCARQRHGRGAGGRRRFRPRAPGRRLQRRSARARRPRARRALRRPVPPSRPGRGVKPDTGDPRGEHRECRRTDFTQPGSTPWAASASSESHRASRASMTATATMSARSTARTTS